MSQSNKADEHMLLVLCYPFKKSSRFRNGNLLSTSEQKEFMKFAFIY